MQMLSRFLAILAITIATPLTALAADFKEPEGDVLLTITHGGNDSQTIELDLAGLEALGLTTIKTSTIWTEGVQVFDGVELATLTKALEITSGTISAVALNDYAVEIPVSDAVEGGPILAIRRNSVPMSVRDKGPVWVIYPYDSSAKYRTEVVYSRSIWQLARIEFME
ncbi:oxidoreductase [Aliiroseovarius sp. F20344]|uniref:oxidoreductase n=1 Tax=Aliiroseovarius sp. F20344 TaxID=2926414 RepID=UPI0032B283A0